MLFRSLQLGVAFGVQSVILHRETSTTVARPVWREVAAGPGMRTPCRALAGSGIEVAQEGRYELLVMLEDSTVPRIREDVAGG